MQPEDVLREIQYLNKYSRFLYEKGRREAWGETVTRTVEYLKKQYPDLDDDTYNSLFMSIFNQEISPSMRLMATAGKAADANQLGIYNCSFLPLAGVRDFHDLTILLGHGVGVGFSVEEKYAREWPVIPVFSEQRYSIEIEDSIQGWAFSFLAQLSNALNGFKTVFDYSHIRPSGTPLITRGGTASGPEPLRQAHEAIRKILEARQGLNLRSVDLFDIACHIAGAIVSGGVRRCLPSGSLVHTRGGMVPIENVEVGTEVLTSKGYHKVSNVFEQGRQKLVRVVTQDSSFACTPNHRVAVMNGDDSYVWKAASELRFGDKLIAPPFIPVNFLRLEDVEEEEETWDLEVEEAHEFFCEGYLVHNSAMIAIFDRSDTDMMTSKSGEWYLDNLQRQYANISFVVDRRMTLQEWQGYVTMMDLNKSGEPGIWSRYAIKRHLPKRRQYVETMGPNPLEYAALESNF